jgi:hypothetical protein
LAPFVTGNRKIVKGPRPFGFVNIRFRPIRHFYRPAPESRADLLKGKLRTVDIDRPPDAGGIDPTEAEEVVFYFPLEPGNKGDEKGILPARLGNFGGPGNILRKQNGAQDQEETKKKPTFLHIYIIIGRNEFVQAEISPLPGEERRLKCVNNHKHSIVIDIEVHVPVPIEGYPQDRRIPLSIQ